MIARRILFAALLAAAPLSAQNLLSNPDFASAITGWTFPSYDTGDWSSLSRTAGSGSAHVASLVRPGTPDAPNVSAEQCIAVAPGHAYAFGGNVYIPGGIAPAASVTASLDARFYDGPSCTGAQIGQQAAVDSTAPRDAWVGLQTSFAAPAGTQSAKTALGAVNYDGSAAITSIEVYVDDAFVFADQACGNTENDLCLAAGRFRVHGSFNVPSQGRSGPMHAVPVTDESGLFWFFEPSNLEVFLKVLNACGLSSHAYWVFASGLTNVEVTIIVDDTVSGQQQTYFNPSGTAFAPVQDTSAFATCP
jgi:hypothetical protein